MFLLNYVTVYVILNLQGVIFVDDKSEKLKKIIKSQYRSIRAFSEATGIPNTTIVTALKNGVGGMAVEKVIAICEKLNIDVKTFEPLPDAAINATLNHNETLLIKKYRQLDADGKQRIENQLNFEVEQLKDKESAPSGAQVS